MKNYKFILLLISSFYVFISCSNKKKLEIVGYAYRNDNILVFENKKNILNVRINGNIDKNKLCSFYETKLKINSSNLKLNFKIDSSNISVLDTCLIIPKEFKSPFVSFVYPSGKTKFKRRILLADDSMFGKD